MEDYRPKRVRFARSRGRLGTELFWCLILASASCYYFAFASEILHVTNNEYANMPEMMCSLLDLLVSWKVEVQFCEETQLGWSF